MLPAIAILAMLAPAKIERLGKSFIEIP